MKRQIPTAMLIALAAVLNASAGTLSGGKWSPANCGIQPVIPKLDSSNVEAYNASHKEIRDWQRNAQAYNDCLVREANSDNAIIAKAANTEQERFRAAVEKIGAEGTATKARLDRQ
ncbi:MAG: hypothetical protein ACRER2_11050 [Methylococcales bacterium]